jgi:transposase
MILRSLMSEDDVDKLDPDAVEDPVPLRGLVRQLQVLIATLQALIAQLRSDVAKRDEALAEKNVEIDELKTALLGPKSERGPRNDIDPKPPVSEAAKKAKRSRARGKAKANRKARNEQLDTERVVHSADDTCPGCGGDGPFVPLRPEVSTEIEYLSERLTRLLHVIEKKLCPCGHIFCGDSPERVVEGGHYGPGLYAHAVVSKCADALPLNRVAKRLGRAGLHIARSTLTDLYHRAAELLAPIHRRLVEIVVNSDYINADETSQPVMDADHCRRGFIWTFIAGGVIAYVFSANRSGDTPRRLLQGTTGALQVDGYTGYNDVCLPAGRTRYGCLAHARRYFHKARDQCPDEAAHCIKVILQLYQVEYDAAGRNILGTETHRLLRKHRSRPIMEEWKCWLAEHKPTMPQRAQWEGQSDTRSTSGSTSPASWTTRRSVSTTTSPRAHSGSSPWAATTSAGSATTSPARTSRSSRPSSPLAWPTTSTRRTTSPMCSCESDITLPRGSTSCYR